MLDFLSFIDDLVSSSFLLTDRDKSTGKDRVCFFVKRMALLTAIVLGVVAMIVALLVLFNTLFLHW